MSKPRDVRQKDLLLPALDQIIDMGHPLVRLAALIDWKFLDDRFGSVCQAGPGQPGVHNLIATVAGVERFSGTAFINQKNRLWPVQL
ncbi:hypothetical protein ACVME8_008756 [Bradyrhizobium diazoefficiens]